MIVNTVSKKGTDHINFFFENIKNNDTTKSHKPKITTKYLFIVKSY